MLVHGTPGPRTSRTSRLLAVVALAAAMVTLPGGASAAAALKGPTGTTARADSMGLAVTVSWSPVARASGYVVHRGSGTFTPTPATRLATVTGTTFRDVAATAGRTLTYRVVALDHAGRPGAAGKAATVSTGDGMAAGRAAATSWLGAQQGGGPELTTQFLTSYPAGHVGPVSGTVAGATSLEGARTELPWVALGAAYDDAYVGPVAGSTGGVSPSGLHVEVFSRPRIAGEPEYWQGSFPVLPDGTWSSGDGIARAGAKVVHLVRDADGARLATSGGVRSGIEGVAVTVYVRTDAVYAQAISPLSAEGAWSVPWVTVPATGEVIARLHDTSTGALLSSTEPGTPPSSTGLLRSFTVPSDDPARGVPASAPVEDRSWIYDDAVAVMALAANGELDRARGVLAALAAVQAPDGSLRFSYDAPSGSPVDCCTRTGATAWVGAAALTYEQVGGDATYRSFAERLADHLLSLQVTSGNGYPTGDPRYGSLLGGYGPDDGSGSPTPVAWASTEHNVDAYFFLRDLGYVTGDARYATAAELVKSSLLTHHWNSAQGRFDQGVGDSAAALDLGSWGGLFLLAVGEDTKAAQSAAWMEGFRVTGATIDHSTDPGSFNTTYASAGPIDGYKPYASGYVDPPSTVWAEGTWGAVLLKMRRGADVTADLQSLQRLQAADPAGGYVQVTQGRSAEPYEFHVWPAVAGTAWAALVTADAGLLWQPDGWHEE